MHQRLTRKLTDLRGVGKSIAGNFHQLGVNSVEELALRDGQVLYDQLCRLTHTRQDPCVLDTFRCAVAQAQDPYLSAEKCNWWWWSRQRKSQAASALY